MNPGTGWCDGCLRTIDEIVAWGSMDDEGKRRVWALLAARRAGGPPGTDPAAAPAR
jgi:hypothetical protein